MIIGMYQKEDLYKSPFIYHGSTLSSVIIGGVPSGVSIASPSMAPCTFKYCSFLRLNFPYQEELLLILFLVFVNLQEVALVASWVIDI